MLSGVPGPAAAGVRDSGQVPSPARTSYSSAAKQDTTATLRVVGLVQAEPLDQGLAGGGAQEVPGSHCCAGRPRRGEQW